MSLGINRSHQVLIHFKKYKDIVYLTKMDSNNVIEPIWIIRSSTPYVVLIWKSVVLSSLVWKSLRIGVIIEFFSSISSLLSSLLLVILEVFHIWVFFYWLLAEFLWSFVILLSEVVLIRIVSILIVTSVIISFSVAKIYVVRIPVSVVLTPSLTDSLSFTFGLDTVTSIEVTAIIFISSVLWVISPDYTSALIVPSVTTTPLAVPVISGFRTSTFIIVIISIMCVPSISSTSTVPFTVISSMFLILLSSFFFVIPDLSFNSFVVFTVYTSRFRVAISCTFILLTQVFSTSVVNDSIVMVSSRTLTRSLPLLAEFPPQPFLEAIPLKVNSGGVSSKDWIGKFYSKGVFVTRVVNI